MTKTILMTILFSTILLTTVAMITSQNAFAEDGVLTDEELAALDVTPAAVPFTKVDQIDLSSGKQVDFYEGTFTTPLSGSFSATLSGFTIDASPSAKFTLLTADGQGFIVPSTLNFNSGTFANPFVSADGLYWDTVTRDVSALVNAGDTSATVVQRATNDCLTHQAIIFAEGTTGALGGYEAAGVGLRTTGTGTITIAGIPASDVPVKAILYWNLLTPSQPSNLVTFASNSVTGTLIGTDTDPCWGQGTTWAFRADVTSLISGNGNAAYSITVPTAGTLPEGATLVIVHDQPADLDQEILDEVRRIEAKLDGERPSLITQIVDVLQTLQKDIRTILTTLQDSTFGLAEIKDEVRNIEGNVTSPEFGLEEIKREVSIIEEEVTKPTVTTFVDTETIDLDGHLKAGDFKLLMDITPFESVTGHVAMKVPCDKQGNTDLAILTGVAPTVTPITMNFVAALSNPGTSCLYHGDIGAGDTDVALINTGKSPVNFGPNEEGFSVTITIHGTE